MLVEKKFTLENENGLHARPSTKIAQLVASYNSEVIIKYNEMEVNAKRVINLLMLGAECGAELHVSIEGDDAEELMASFSSLVEGKFSEE